MNSLDTNVLVYAANEDCDEHAKANQLVNDALSAPSDWIIADQVLFEYYKALRHPGILSKPLSAPAAAEQIRFLRETSGFMVCCYELVLWGRVIDRLSRRDFPYQRTHDQILAQTLLHNGVKSFFTRNTKDFDGIGFEKLVNPIDG
jgi:predicted nucleic acid-binding protein